MPSAPNGVLASRKEVRNRPPITGSEIERELFECTAKIRLATTIGNWQNWQLSLTLQF
jgi:hypothetical protein